MRILEGADRIVVMDRGRALAAGTLAELQHVEGAGGPSNGSTLHLASAEDARAVARLLAERGLQLHAIDLAGIDEILTEEAQPHSSASPEPYGREPDATCSLPRPTRRAT